MGKNAKDKRDIYYRLAKQKNYRSRSAFKLIQIDFHFKIFDNLDSEDLVVDLCSSPGGWSQVCVENLEKKNTTNNLEFIDNRLNNEFCYVIAIDIQKMDIIEGVKFIQGDITNEKTIDDLKNYSGNRSVKLVICDGAPDITGFTEFDLHIQEQLVYSALNFALKSLANNGSFITKLYKGKNTNKILNVLGLFFNKITISKPKACRNASFEAFLICEKFNYDKYNICLNNIEKKLIVANNIIKNYFSTNINEDIECLEVFQIKKHIMKVIYNKLKHIISIKLKKKLLNSDMIFFNSISTCEILSNSIEDIVNAKCKYNLDIKNIIENKELNVHNIINIKYFQVGQENFDSDKSYNLESTNYFHKLNPLQMPIDPPYKMYLENYKGKINK